MAKVTNADFKQFSDWAVATGPTYVFVLMGYLIRYNLDWKQDILFDGYQGVVHYSNLGHILTPTTTRLMPGDFFGALSVYARTPPYKPTTRQVLMSISLGNPVIVDLQFLGGPLNGATVHSAEIDSNPKNNLVDFNIVLNFRSQGTGEHIYALTLQKEGYPEHFAHL